MTKHGKWVLPNVEKVKCPHCKKEFDDFDFDMIEPIAYEVKNDKEWITSDEYGDLMVLKSPYFTYAQFCSPCAPGAVYLVNPLKDENNKGYCLGHDWFEGGKAPYPVYDIKTGKLIKPS